MWFIYCKPTLDPLCCDWFSRGHAVQCYWQKKDKNIFTLVEVMPFSVTDRKKIKTFSPDGKVYFPGCFQLSNKINRLLFKSIIFKPLGKLYGKIELVQKEWCCFLAHEPFEQMHGSKFNMANYIHQILSYIVPFIENKTKSNCSMDNCTTKLLLVGRKRSLIHFIPKTSFLWFSLR